MTSPPTEARTTVGSVMHSGVVTCPPDATLRRVAGILAANRIHAVVVVSPDEAAPRAVVTDRDVVFGHARGDLDRLTARDAARRASRPSPSEQTSTCDTHPRPCPSHGTTHIVVTAPGDGRPIGILSSLDIANAVGAK